MISVSRAVSTSIPTATSELDFICSRKLARFAAQGLMLVAIVSGTWTVASAQTKAATITSIAVTSGGGPVTTIASPSVVTLTAVVRSGSTVLTAGQINFCDASAKGCTDIHILGTAR
jgi:hypothetical protein